MGDIFITATGNSHVVDGTYMEAMREHDKKVYVLPKKLDEEVARLHLVRFRANLSKLTQAQADYIGVPQEDPFKPDHYR